MQWRNHESCFQRLWFFIPKTEIKNCSILRKSYKTIISVEELQYLVKDEGVSKEDIVKITESENEISFVTERMFIRSCVSYRTNRIF